MCLKWGHIYSKAFPPYNFLGWEWEDLSDDNEVDKGCEQEFDDESFYAESEFGTIEATKDTPKQIPKALRSHPTGGRLAPTPDDFQVQYHYLSQKAWILVYRVL